jgi:hypothetical protein
MSQIVAGPPPYVFGFEDTSTGYRFTTAAIGETGVTAEFTHSGLIYGFDNELAYGRDYVIASSGHVVDVRSPKSPVLAGTFPFQGEVIPRTERGQVLMLSYARPASYGSTSGGTNQLVLRALSLDAFRADIEVPLPGQYGRVQDFVEVDLGVFAFIDSREGDYVGAPPSNLYLFSVSGI